MKKLINLRRLSHNNHYLIINNHVLTDANKFEIFGSENSVVFSGKHLATTRKRAHEYLQRILSSSPQAVVESLGLTGKLDETDILLGNIRVNIIIDSERGPKVIPLVDLNHTISEADRIKIERDLLGDEYTPLNWSVL